MAKRYHDGRAKMLEGREFYAGEQARHTQEAEDGGMLHEDRSAIANMPQNIIMRPYPKNNGYLPEDLDDSIRGIDMQIDMDDRKRREHFKPKKV
jgi:hypothetical protein